MTQQSELDVLYPEAPLRHAPQDVTISEIRMEDDFSSASGSLVKSVKRFGILEPVILEDHGDEGYQVIDGRRRVRAAVEAKLTKIPARVFDADDVARFSPVLAVALNEERSDNPVTKFDSVVELALHRNIPEDKIARATGLTIPTVKALLSLTSVYTPIIVAMREGKVKFSVVRMIAKVARKAQETLYHDIFAAKGTITARDVREQCPDIVDAQDVLPEAWNLQAIVTLRELLSSAPAGALTAPVELAIEALEQAAV